MLPSKWQSKTKSIWLLLYLDIVYAYTPLNPTVYFQAYAELNKKKYLHNYTEI